MRSLIIILVLACLMIGLRFFESTLASGSAVEPMSLVSFGFILMVAFVIGDIAARLKLPRVTGYLFTGIVFGPFVGNFFSLKVVDDLSLMNSLAVGLIALTAGGELKVSDLKRNLRSILVIIGIQLLIILPLVMGTFHFSSQFFVNWDSLGISPTLTFTLALGAMIGALAVGNSPAVGVAIVKDTKAQGPFTNLNLGVTITKDLVVVVIFSVITAIAFHFLATDPSGGFGDALFLLAEEIGISVLSGLAIGLVILGYLRFTAHKGERDEVGEDFALLLVGLIFLGMFMCESLHLEKVLVFIVAGFVVENFSASGHRLIEGINSISPPVYVVFFAVAGSALDLIAIREVLAICLIVALIRIAAMLLATKLGARASKLDKLYEQKLGMGFFSQAGVTLGLVLIAADKLAGLNSPIGDAAVALFVPVVLGIVAINLVIGPIFLKISLSQAGEVPQNASSKALECTPKVEVVQEAELTPQPPIQASPAKPATETPPRPSLDGPDPIDLSHHNRAIQNALIVIKEGLSQTVDEYRWQVIESRRNHAEQILDRLRKLILIHFEELGAKLGTTSPIETQRRAVRKARLALAQSCSKTLTDGREDFVESEADALSCDPICDAIQALREAVPKAIGVDESAALFQKSPGDGFYLRTRKAISRLRRRLSTPRPRIVPIRRLVEFNITGPMPDRLLETTNEVGYQGYYFWHKVDLLMKEIDRGLGEILTSLSDPIQLNPSSQAADERVEIDAKETLAQVNTLAKKLNEEFHFAIEDIQYNAEEIHHRLDRKVQESFAQLSRSCEIAGTYLLPNRHINTSSIYDQHRKARGEITAVADRWRILSTGYSGRILAVLDIVDLQHALFGRMAEAKISIADALLNQLKAIPATLVERLKHGRTKIDTLLDAEVTEQEKSEQLERTREKLSAFISTNAIAELETARDRGHYMDLLEPFMEQVSIDCARLVHTHQTIDQLPEHINEGYAPPALELRELPIRSPRSRAPGQ